MCESASNFDPCRYGPKYLGQGEFLRKRSDHDRTPIVASKILQSRCCSSRLAPNRPSALQPPPGWVVSDAVRNSSRRLLALLARRSIGGQSLQDGPSAALRRGRVLASDQIAVDDHVWVPVGRFRIDAAVLFKHIFHEERHDLRQSDGRLLRIGEAGHEPAFDQRITIRGSPPALSRSEALVRETREPRVRIPVPFKAVIGWSAL